jgi:hypothetical protein
MDENNESKSPEQTILEFLRYWKNKDWNKMSRLLQPTWKSHCANVQDFCKKNYQYIRLIKYELVSKDVKSPLMCDVICEITANIIAGTKRKRITKQLQYRLIKETAPYTPSENGVWGINLSSFRWAD